MHTDAANPLNSMRNTALSLLMLAVLEPSAPAQDAPAGPLSLAQTIQAVLARYPHDQRGAGRRGRGARPLHAG